MPRLKNHALQYICILFKIRKNTALKPQGKCLSNRIPNFVTQITFKNRTHILLNIRNWWKRNVKFLLLLEFTGVSFATRVTRIQLCLLGHSGFISIIGSCISPIEGILCSYFLNPQLAYFGSKLKPETNQYSHKAFETKIKKKTVPE